MNDQTSRPMSAKSDVSMVERPPNTVWGILRRIGPGLIVAGSIVGSGELIATTKTGAEAGFWLLWLILIGCVIKVFVQVEFGRYSIVNGRSTMEGMNEVPGPRISGRGNWLVWYWFVMWFASIAQLGGIVGGVGQALAISMPLTEEGRQYNDYVDLHTQLQVKRGELERLATVGIAAEGNDDSVALVEQQIRRLAASMDKADDARLAELGEDRFRELGGRPPAPYDDRIWAGLLAVVTSVLLYVGRYGLIQNFSTFMVCTFTFITIGNLIALQYNVSWRVNWEDIFQGLRFRLPPAVADSSLTPLATALATFGIIGVGAAEIISYPYWCLEKGYARFTGPRDTSAAWASRAQGWMRVMRWDAWCSMFVYTFATIAFYLLGAAILHRIGLNPAGLDMIRTLAVMYEPVFSEWAAALFLFGAFAVLYSTYFVANAGHARVFSDALGVLRFASPDSSAIRRRVKLLGGFFPLLCLVIYLLFPQPTRLVLISGVMQAIMLPMLAFAGLFFRYRRNDSRLNPGKTWDAFLWLSAAGMFVAGVWTAISEGGKLLNTIQEMLVSVF